MNPSSTTTDLYEVFNDSVDSGADIGGEVFTFAANSGGTISRKVLLLCSTLSCITRH